MKRRKAYIDQIMMVKKNEQSNYFIGLEVDILPMDKIALLAKAIDFLDYTGRLLGKREGFDLNRSRIFEYCVKKVTAVEINAWPARKTDIINTLDYKNFRVWILK